MKVLDYKLYKITSPIQMGVTFVESKSETGLFEFLYELYRCTPVHVVEITRQGRTPKVAIYTNPEYKKLEKVGVKDQYQSDLRVVHGRIYRITGQLDGQVQFIECQNEKELIEHIFFNWRGLPTNVVNISPTGTTPRVAILTHPYYKELSKNYLEIN